jgi:hypothetical protein
LAPAPILAILNQSTTQVRLRSGGDERLIEHPAEIPASATQDTCLRQPLDSLGIATRNRLDAHQSRNRNTALEHVQLGPAPNHV